MIVGDLWSDTNRGIPRYSENACPSAPFSAITQRLAWNRDWVFEVRGYQGYFVELSVCPFQ
jgi:hypothetical protein